MSHLVETHTFEGQVYWPEGVSQPMFEGRRADRPKGNQGFYSTGVGSIVRDALGSLPKDSKSGKKVRITVQVIEEE